MPFKMKASNIHIEIIAKAYTFLFLLFIGNNADAQKDSLIFHSQRIKLGMTSSTVDSLMPFYIAKMQKAAGGTWRYIYDSIYQSTTDYQDKEWNSYTFRMLFKMDKLIYFDLYFYKTQKILHSQVDSFKIKELIRNFNKQYNASDNFSSILKSFDTKVYNLGNPLDKFFSNASVKDKKMLLAYSKSLCPEYSASAIIRILELEKNKQFLSATEKLTLKEIMRSEIQVQFIIGCVYHLATFSDFLDEYNPELKDIIK
jgi:hypothetical protein